jgi:lysophospholipase
MGDLNGMLPAKFNQPPNFTEGHFKNAKGADIRYGVSKADGVSKGSIVIGSGFRENIEKYYEVMRDLNSRGFDVYMLDWRGQGGSEKFIKGSQKAHQEGYSEQIDTLHQFVTTIVEPVAKKPLIYMGHSMGAHIGLRYLNEHDGVFDSAILTSPMIDIVTNGMPKKLARQMAKFAKAGNYLEKYIPGGADWSEEPFKGNNKTSDPVRFAADQEIVKNNDALKIGDATYGWVYHTFSSIDVLNDEDYLKAIKTPILMEIAGQEKIVDRAAQDRALTLLPNAKKVEIADAKHEIWMERDELRDQWLKEVDGFLNDRVTLSLAPPAPKKPNPPSKPRPPGM